MANEENVTLNRMEFEDIYRMKENFEINVDRPLDDDVYKLILFLANNYRQKYDSNFQLSKEDEAINKMFDLQDIETSYEYSTKIFHYLNGKAISYQVKEVLIDIFKSGDFEKKGCGWFIQEISSPTGIVVMTDLELIYVCSDYCATSDVCIVC